MSGESASAQESAGRLPRQYLEALGMEGNPTLAEGLARAEQQLNAVLEQGHKYPEKHPAQVKIKRDREHLEPLVRELREMVFGRKVDELCDNAEAALAEQPPKTAKIRDLLKRARAEGNALNPDSDYLRRVQKLEALLDRDHPAETPRPETPPVIVPAPAGELEAHVGLNDTPHAGPDSDVASPVLPQPVLPDFAAKDSGALFEDVPPTLPFMPPEPNTPLPNQKPVAPSPDNLSVDVPPPKPKKRAFVFIILAGLVLIAVAYAGYLAFVRAPATPNKLAGGSASSAPPPTNQPAGIKTPPPSAPPETPPAPDAGPGTAQDAVTPEVVQPEIGRVSITAKPGDAQLFTNGVALGPPGSPAQLRGLSRSELTVEARLEGYSNALQKVVFPAPGAEAILIIELQPKPAILFVRSEPAATEIVLRKGRGPSVNAANAAEGIQIAPGEAVEVSLNVPDYETVSREIPALKPGQSLVIDFGRLTAQTGGLRLKVEPRDAQFTVIFPGRGPSPYGAVASIDGLPSGVTFEVIAQHSGYLSATNTFFLRPHEVREYDFGRLTSIAPIIAVVSNAPPQVGEASRPSEPSHPSEASHSGALSPTGVVLTILGPNDGADIFVDNHFTGVKNGGSLSNLVVGRMLNIRLHKAGYRDISHIVTIRGNDVNQKEYFAALPFAGAVPIVASANAQLVLGKINESIVKVKASLPLTENSRRQWNLWIAEVQNQYQADAQTSAYIHGSLEQLRVLVNTTGAASQ